MESEPPEEVDIESLMAALRPPTNPDETFNRDNVDLFKIRTWNKRFAVSVLAGLSTDPAFHANGIRLDWLQRLVFSKSQGRRKPHSAELSRALNAGLDRANVLRLEDPIEDLFCDLVATPHGNYRIFPGQWEAAAPYTQTLLNAFESLPPGSRKRDALKAIYSLLKLSDEIAERASVHRFTPSAGEPMGLMAVPNTDALKRLARRVRFTDKELDRLHISKDALIPFLLEPQHFPYISDREAGETPLEFYPLLATSNGIIVASPTSISLAVRAVMIRAAQLGGIDKVLLSSLLKEQQKYSEASGFWPVPSLELTPPNQHFMRAAVCRFAQGRFFHIIQVPPTFDLFPERAFGSIRVLGENANKALSDDVLKFWRFLESQPDYQESITVLLLSGWGAPHSVSPSIEESKAPEGWRFLALSFADAAVLGACKDGKFRDIWRVIEQVDRIEAEGFSIQNVNGVLNLFGFWRATDGNLIPEHLSEIEPPCNLLIPTDDLLAPRIEASVNRDFRALPLPDGNFKMVQRIDWTDPDDLQPIYGSIEDANEGRLLGAVSMNERTWWIEIAAEAGEVKEWRYRIWHAVLRWLAAVGSDVVASFPQAIAPGATRIEICIPAGMASEKIDSSSFGASDLAATVTGSRENKGRAARLEVSLDWMKHLDKPENDAEVELIAAVLEQIADPSSATASRDQLREVVHSSIGSGDWRWLHAHQVATPVDRLASSGLVGRFREISLSAVSLIKCGSVWGFRARSEGLEIDGEENCRDFLTQYRDHILDELISQVQKFDRKKLIILAAENYQSARLEKSHWHRTIRALRAIHGATADAHAFARQNAINAVQRAAKSVCEIAACEAPQVAGANPGPADLEEMFARALLLFGNGQLFASIRSGLVKPKLGVSPAGDLLSDRSVFETALRPGAEWTNTRALNDAAEAYGRDRSEKVAEVAERKLPFSEALRTAVEAEYAVSAEAFVDLQHAVIQIAEERGKGVFSMKRSELSCLLAANKLYPSDDPAALLERLTLSHRPSWRDRSSGLSESDIDLGRFDRRFSIINRPLLAMDNEADPHLLIAPIFVSDSTMYSLSSLMDGSLHGQFWTSLEAKKYAGMRANAAGAEFEESVAERLRELGLEAWPRCKPSWALNEKVDGSLGDIDVLAVSPDRHRVWVIEAKNLRLCRTEAEVAARFSEYRGRMIQDSRGRDKPDKMLRHIRRVQYLRQRSSALCGRLKLVAPPEVRGLLIVDAPQPMNFYMLEQLEDGESAFLDAIDSVDF